MEIQHIAHRHSLILNENYIAREGDVCFACKEIIVSCKSFVYSCSSICSSSTESECVKFLLHKNCAELPPNIQNPTNQKQFLTLRYEYPISILQNIGFHCYLCGVLLDIYYGGIQLFYCSNDPAFLLCVRCAVMQIESLEVPTFCHPAHTQHPLALVHRPSSFKCNACNVDDDSKDLSYRCTKCQFWMHKTCADSPTSFKFHCHDKHPLVLTFSLPPQYHKFYQYCKLCTGTLSRFHWLYYCPKCRFFAHFHCARSNQTSLRSTSADEEYDSKLVQLPPADESLVDVLYVKFLEAMSTQYHYDDSKTGSTNHWAHREHPLQLITISELNDQKDDDEMLLQCDGCTKPIKSNGDQFYGCVPCKFFMHKFCADFTIPREFKHHFFTNTHTKWSEPYKLFTCQGCSLLCNGIFIDMIFYKLHIGCVALPQIIKHEAHHHQLNKMRNKNPPCIACYTTAEPIYECKKCKFYICYGCIMKPRRVEHKWDPHPLSLIYDPSMVSDHEHEFVCEYCSDEIDTNMWFYHCSDCDLSFHLDCLLTSTFSQYSNVKFGATDIMVKKLHPHNLRFVLNKKFRLCEKCCQCQLGAPVLECVPCKAIFCIHCAP